MQRKTHNAAVSVFLDTTVGGTFACAPNADGASFNVTGMVKIEAWPAGAVAVFDCGGRGRALRFAGVRAVVHGVHFQRGVHRDLGGAVLAIDSQLQLVGCTFSDCAVCGDSDSEPDAVSDAEPRLARNGSVIGRGGGAVAVFGTGSQLTVSGCSFESCSARFCAGGALMAELEAGVSNAAAPLLPSLLVSGSSFSNCSANSAGAMFLLDGLGSGGDGSSVSSVRTSSVGSGSVWWPVSVVSSTFSDCRATLSGGAMRVMVARSNSSLLVADSQFTSCEAVIGHGGAIDAWDLVNGTHDWRFRDAVFEGCSAQQGGGAVRLQSAGNGVSHGRSTRFERCVFANGQADRGGAVRVALSRAQDSLWLFSDCSFVANTAVHSGGGVCTDPNFSLRNTLAFLGW